MPIFGGSTSGGSSVSQASAAEVIAGSNVDKYVAPDVLVSAIGQAGPLQTAISGPMRTLRSFGAIGDGTSHALSTVYASLGAAQVDFPLATSLTQQIDRVAIQKACAAGVDLDFENLNYYLGTLSSSGEVVGTVAASDLTFRFCGAKFSVTTGVSGWTYLFSLDQKERVSFTGRWTVTENSGSLSNAIWAVFLYDAWKDVTVDDLHVINCMGGVGSAANSSGDYGTARRGRFRVTAVGGDYGITLAENGDHCHCEVLAKSCRRPIFLYGVKSIYADVWHDEPDGSFTSIIKRYNRNTENIHLRIFSSLTTTGIQPREAVAIDHQNGDAANSVIRDITVEVHMRHTNATDPGGYAYVMLYSYTAGGSLNTTNPHTYKNIRVIASIGSEGGTYNYSNMVNSTFTSSTPSLAGQFRLGKQSSNTATIGSNLVSAGATNADV